MIATALTTLGMRSIESTVREREREGKDGDPAGKSSLKAWWFSTGQ